MPKTGIERLETVAGRIIELAPRMQKEKKALTRGSSRRQGTRKNSGKTQT